MNGKKIGEAFEAAVAGIVPCYLAEAETEEYPFLVYDQLVSPISTKDGVVAYDSYLACTIYSEDPDEAENIAAAVAAAVKTAESMRPYGLHPDTVDRGCSQGIWEFSMAWNIHQNTISPASSGSGSGTSGVGA